jgi:hypothetical protein
MKLPSTSANGNPKSDRHPTLSSGNRDSPRALYKAMKCISLDVQLINMALRNPSPTNKTVTRPRLRINHGKAPWGPAEAIPPNGELPRPANGHLDRRCRSAEAVPGRSMASRANGKTQVKSVPRHF